LSVVPVNFSAGFADMSEFPDAGAFCRDNIHGPPSSCIMLESASLHGRYAYCPDRFGLEASINCGALYKEDRISVKDFSKNIL
jgi:hypothetical protein